ncbi:PVC-type heme-binding CxxCH protein [Humisphaera borealis]|uniref:HEAT repeat domain-containing protein n=1 Tax=Humisphaera borealis TaxID=2807512 RepID=A0A7M2WWH7_9BACT|nr:PVC-type heme-binding CxxCH protein [Humisphaera borealis]QOV88860.1 HEAT repeat domain-containing protein [Humisphaera borealis]
MRLLTLITVLLTLPLAAAEPPAALTPDQERAAMHVLDGFEVSLFASEADGVINPIQMRWDERGRLWVACSPNYPQLEPGKKPADYILVLEDTNGDGRADKATRFAEGLLVPTGLELGAPGQLYVANGTELLLFTDSDGDLKADKREVLFSGFGTGDGHQMINSFQWGPGGDLWFSQGAHTFSNIETPWGVERLYSAGVWRMRPRTQKLDPFLDSRRGHPTNSWAGPANPWGFAFDKWGSMFLNDAAGNKGLSWASPAMIRSDRHVQLPYLWKIPKGCGIDIVGSTAMPDELQGRLILGHYFTASVRQFAIKDDSSGFALTELPPLITCDNNAFRIVDVKNGPDGSLYLCDWYNPVIGHYQASYRDPARDKTHGRIWRLSAKGRATTRQPNLAAMLPAELMDQLRSSDRWLGYQVDRLLFTGKSDEAVKAADAWIAKLDPADPQYEHLLYRATGVLEAHEVARPKLLAKLMDAKDFGARAYAARLIGRWHNRLDEPLVKLAELAQDEHPRVRVEAIVASTFVPSPHAIEVAAMAADKPIDQWIEHAMLRAVDAQKDLWRPAFLKGELDFGDKVNRLSWVLRCDGSTEMAAPLRKMLEDPDVAVAGKPDLAIVLANIGAADDLGYLLEKFGSEPRVLSELANAARVRQVKPAGDISTAVAKAFDDANPEVRTAAIRLAGALKMASVADRLKSIAGDGTAGAAVRVAAIDALGDWKALKTGEFAPLTKPDQPMAVRIAAIGAMDAVDRPAAASAAVGLLGSTDKDEDVGAVLAIFLSRKGGPAALGKAIASASLSPKSAQKCLDVIHARGRDDAALVDALKSAMGVSDATPPYSEDFVRQLSADAARNGDAKRGKTLYETKLVACAACHSIDGKGGNLGPDMSGIGRGLTSDYIVESVLWPRRQVKEGFLSISISTKSGDEFSGYAISETGEEMQLRDVATNTIQRIAKANIAKRVNAGTIMPEGLTAGLSREELQDLVAYLCHLGK